MVLSNKKRCIEEVEVYFMNRCGTAANFIAESGQGMVSARREAYQTFP